MLLHRRVWPTRLVPTSMAGSNAHYWFPGPGSRPSFSVQWPQQRNALSAAPGTHVTVTQPYNPHNTVRKGCLLFRQAVTGSAARLPLRRLTAERPLRGAGPRVLPAAASSHQ